MARSARVTLWLSFIGISTLELEAYLCPLVVSIVILWLQITLRKYDDRTSAPSSSTRIRCTFLLFLDAERNSHIMMEIDNSLYRVRNAQGHDAKARTTSNTDVKPRRLIVWQKENTRYNNAPRGNTVLGVSKKWRESIVNFFGRVQDGLWMILGVEIPHLLFWTKELVGRLSRHLF